jgi:hypothetical protein
LGIYTVRNIKHHIASDSYFGSHWQIINERGACMTENNMEAMSFLEALDYTNNGNHITYMTRDDWSYELYFCPRSRLLMITDIDSENITMSTPYVISSSDFDHEWRIVNPYGDRYEIR